ncbi:hypothetical protein SAY87_025298 [Trapa incisa]|uniref:Zinc finger PHD-type domain-containing protein n=1 Tax=Trapa incisa TaxID=236973 RepID=A0AAN7GAP8_9MYRT|nr:hypothetical protein SAY87_025298 [Trapa incisa]
MVVNGRPLKRMKRRVTADLYDFFTFPSAETVTDARTAAAITSGPFRTNVRDFISKYALPPPPSLLFPHLMVWQVLFRAGDLTDSLDSVVYLDIIEEDVARSRSVYCDQCRVVGWSDHPVCRTRYHFIIKADGSPLGGYPKPCICCGELLHLSDSRCKSCNHVMTQDVAEEWIYQQLEDSVNTHHLLHAVVHANGFGHLLRVNGKEGGSKVLSGCDMMDFWDRLCKMLRVRKITVMDVSKKYGLEYRLLHAVMKGYPWYGNWGYEFCVGSFGVTYDIYADAVKTLSNLPLSTFIHSEQGCLQNTVVFYKSLSEKQEQHDLVNIRDLFVFLMNLIQNAHKSSPMTTYCVAWDWSGAVPDTTFTHRSSDVGRVQEAMVKVLLAVTGSKWVSWRTLRGAVCRLGTPQLLDYCLRGLAGKTVSGGLVVVARIDPSSGATEYRLEPRSNAPSGITTCNGSRALNLNCPSVENLLWDLRYLYECILRSRTTYSSHGQHPMNYVLVAAAAAQKLLDCKTFMKDYDKDKLFSGYSGIQSGITLFCQVELADQDEVANFTPSITEIINLQSDATVSDLKIEASRTFQDVYLMFHRFQAEELLDYSGVDDSTQVKLIFAVGSSDQVVRIRGRCIGKIGPVRYRMERGDENWIVDCRCGAKDDDGERMMACDICSVWQHTRCSGIADSESVPSRFICCRCSSSDQTT